MTDVVRKVVILGGGSSGWMSACYLRRAFPSVDITVVEPPDIPRIGVGEATVPNFQSAFWRHLGIAEDEWMREVRATLKLGIRFVDWSIMPDGRPSDFYHLFGIMPECDGIPLSHYWVHRALDDAVGEQMDMACYTEAHLADARISPRHVGEQSDASYAWHFDVNLMVDYLRRLAEGWDVSLVPDHVASTEVRPDGTIDHVVTGSGQRIEGDLFVDCTGFAGVLIDGALHEPFRCMNGSLLCDQAVATRVCRPAGANGIDPYTTATALRGGWTWNIPLVDRLGVGYVHSSQHVSMDEAVVELSEHLGVDPEDQEWNRIRFRVGRRERSWVKNCVAIGLSSNFLEPLESTALYLTYGALYQLVRFFPEATIDPYLRERFNEEIAYAYDDCRDFVQMHYIVNNRREEFWLRNQHELEVSDSLSEKLQMFRSGLPINAIRIPAGSYYDNFELEYRNFWTNGSYYTVLTGLGRLPESVYPKLLYRGDGVGRAAEMMAEVPARAADMAQGLPTHERFLAELHGSR